MAALEYLLGLVKGLLPWLFHPWVYKKIARVKFTDPANGGHVPGPHFNVHGKYFWTPGRTIALFTVENHNYFFQGPAALNPTHKTWTKDIGIGAIPNVPNHIVVAAITKDFAVSTYYYGRVHERLLENNPPINTWYPIEMFPDQIPEGFIELDRIIVQHP